MIFTIMGNELRDASYTSTTVSFDNYTTSAVMNYTVVSTNAVAVSGVTSTLRNCQMTITAIYNLTGGNNSMGLGNLSATGCKVYTNNALHLDYNNTKLNISGSYRYDNDNTATNTMNDTVHSLAGAIDFNDVIIVIGAMLVLISLVVLIVISIKSSGIMGSSKGSENIGTA